MKLLIFNTITATVRLVPKEFDLTKRSGGQTFEVIRREDIENSFGEIEHFNILEFVFKTDNSSFFQKIKPNDWIDGDNPNEKFVFGILNGRLISIVIETNDAENVSVNLHLTDGKNEFADSLELGIVAMEYFEFTKINYILWQSGTLNYALVTNDGVKLALVATFKQAECTAKWAKESLNLHLEVKEA